MPTRRWRRTRLRVDELLAQDKVEEAEALIAEEEERLAAEGYRFYAQEASEFAEASAAATAEALGHDG